MKPYESVKDIEAHAVTALTDLLREVPVLALGSVSIEDGGRDSGASIKAHLTIADRPHVLVCEVKSSGQPRHVRTAILQLRNTAAHQSRPATPILIAPYLSPEAQALCQESNVGYLDFEGNARIVFGSVFIERRVPGKPPVERRDLKSLFKPKSAAILRALLRDPGRAWRVVELAEHSMVSLGHVSNVRTALRDREWARVTPDGFSLTDPNSLLDAWRDAYEPRDSKRLRFYTTLHGSAFDKAAAHALGVDPKAGQAVLASFSAAQWFAPYGRITTHYFQADTAGLRRLQNALGLSSPEKGENVVVTLPKDLGIFRDTDEPAPGMVCTSPVQTYLDLSAAGERGREAAEHLRGDKLRWPK